MYSNKNISPNRGSADRSVRTGSKLPSDFGPWIPASDSTFFDNNILLYFENDIFLDPDQLVLQSQLPQNPDPEADPKIVFHCLP